MGLFRNQRTAFLTSAFLAVSVAIPVSLPLVGVAYADDTLSVKVGTPLQAAQTALAAKNYGKAMASVDAADAVSGKSDYETYTVAQMRAAVAAQSNDVPAAIKAYDVLIASSRTPGSAKLQMMMAQASLAYQAKNYAATVKATEAYLKAAGPKADPKMQTVLVQAYYQQKDFANAARVQKEQIDAEIKAGRIPSENQLQFLVACYRELKDADQQTHAFVLLAKYYSKPDYWAALIHNLAANPKLPASLQFNLLRLRAATGTLTSPDDYIDMAERAMEAGQPQLAVNLLNQGFSNGVLGKGTGAAREAKLRAMAVSRAADTKAALAGDASAAATAPTAGPALTTGYNMVLAGQVPAGLALMKQGLAKKPRFPDVALLDYGMAQMDGGLKKDAAQTFNTVKSDNGSQDLAQLWELLISRPVTSGK
ncbi:hypothetical protein [Brytella acorum]|uniref:Tetratricopeptide repeat protein n=1 Tax=Brytella acorum TaxID=2959299 RepID=A0AA35Y4T9_9PROT|nr:hypothetical protein [Brytella acorum]CAI9122184.1 hypothetical protein LMG32879_003044 [Brytella acorum]